MSEHPTLFDPWPAGWREPWAHRAEHGEPEPRVLYETERAAALLDHEYPLCLDVQDRLGWTVTRLRWVNGARYLRTRPGEPAQVGAVGEQPPERAARAVTVLWDRALHVAVEHAAHADLEAAAAALTQRTSTAHERVSCPLCDAPVGERCRRMPIGYVGARDQRTGGWKRGAVLEHAHVERLRADGVELR